MLHDLNPYCDDHTYNAQELKSRKDLMKRLSLRFNPNDPGFEVYDPVTGALLLRLLYVLPLAEQGDVYQLRSPQGELLGSGSMMTTLLNDFFASEVDVQFVY